MTNYGQVYKCTVCGNIVELLHPGQGTLICCGQPMKLLKENTVDASKEKHIPALTKVDGGFQVTVGSVPHPMEANHYIEWIELQVAEEVLRRQLKPGDSPAVVFYTTADLATARAYCNLHGLWKSNEEPIFSQSRPCIGGDGSLV